jgi:Streptomycin adenylyltransferase
MFTVEQRDRAREWVLERARRDERVLAAAVVGAEASGRMDRWSDLDLTFAVADATVEEVVDEWTDALGEELDAAFLFDVWVGPIVYRVFLLPGNLQVDLSFTPAEEFGPHSSDFKLLFGRIAKNRERLPMSRLAEGPRQQFGLCVLYLLRARINLERGRLPSAEHYLRSARELLGEAGPEPDDGLERSDLLELIAATLDSRLAKPGEARELAARLEPELRELTRPTLDAG